MIERNDLYIDGQWVTPAGGDVITVDEAATGEIIGTVPAGDVVDGERAIVAARRSFDEWAQVPIAERADVVTAIATGLREREDELARIMAQEVGTPLATSVRVQVGLAASVFETIAEAARELPAEERIGNSMVLRVPAGVVGAITPWNYPLYQLAAKVGPALAAGCTVVVKPSSVAPLATFVLADIVDGLGLPAGAFNLVSGRGALVGDLLSSHPEVDMVSLTGSTGAGVQVARSAAGTIKKVALELGGKSAFLLAEGADMDAAMSAAVRGCFVNNGQTCSATTRLIVPRSLLAEVEERVAAAVNAYVVGDPLDAGHGDRTGGVGGPVPHGVQVHRDRHERGHPHRRRARAGGRPRSRLLRQADGVQPTRPRRRRSCRRRSSGRCSRSSPTTRASSRASRSPTTASSGCRAPCSPPTSPRPSPSPGACAPGQVAVNGGRFNAKAPFGGFKTSGVGRELGHHGLMEYFELLSLQFPSADDLGSFGQTV